MQTPGGEATSGKKMDRFAWTDGVLQEEEQLVVKQSGVKLYDGNAKTNFQQGVLQLTTHRLIWRHYKDQKCILSLHLSFVVFIEEEPSTGFHKSPKILLHLNPAPAYKPPGPVSSSSNQHVKLSFKDGGETEFFRCLQETVSRQLWNAPVLAPQAAGEKKFHSGITGIERKLQEKQKLTDQSISQAFQDLSKLMEKAKDMVALSKNISNRIKDKQGDVTEDETVRFKSYLLSLGIADPVTRETHGSGNKYFTELARQINSVMAPVLKDNGGMMTLTDVYCRVNRARGMELLSPEDLVNACKAMEGLGLSTRLRIFETGVMVLQLESHNEEEIITKTTEAVERKGSLTADELSREAGVSVVLCKERLLLAEKVGGVCRDESIEGLRFYPNLFLTKEP